MQSNMKSKGFTIIELLVVVAIIAVLTGIVLVNVTSYINNGKNASIQGNLSTISTNASVLFESTGSYAGLCVSDTYATASQAITVAYGSGNLQTCFVDVDNTAFCACSNLKMGNSFCVDSTGTKKVTGNACAVECPSAAAPACV